jgi:DnaJ-class molecular chaperone
MQCSICKNDISIVSHKSWCKDYAKDSLFCPLCAGGKKASGMTCPRCDGTGRRVGKFKVNIDYKKGPSFSMEIYAENKRIAFMLASNESRKNGFDETIKRHSAIVIEI